MADAEQNRSGPAADENWERDLLNRLAFAALNEQRRTRRWNIFFRSLLFAYLFLLLFIALPFDFADKGLKVGRHVALVDLNGMISESSPANADDVTKGLRAAYEDVGTAGVILRINSPGGSPVQSAIIYDEIRRLREKRADIPVYAVITDLCASGGYYVAAAADGIYANRASIVGSIGVLMNGFGFVGTLEKLGVERRLLTAGEHKGFMDPFSPMKETDVQHIRGILGRIHEQFAQAVRTGRGGRLKESDALFSGLVWTGEEALDLGLIDGLASADQVAREVIGVERVVDFTPRPHYLELFADRLGASVGRLLSGWGGASLR